MAPAHFNTYVSAIVQYEIKAIDAAAIEAAYEHAPLAQTEASRANDEANLAVADAAQARKYASLAINATDANEAAAYAKLAHAYDTIAREDNRQTHSEAAAAEKDAAIAEQGDPAAAQVGARSQAMAERAVATSETAVADLDSVMSDLDKAVHPPAMLGSNRSADPSSPSSGHGIGIMSPAFVPHVDAQPDPAGQNHQPAVEHLVVTDKASADDVPSAVATLDAGHAATNDAPAAELPVAATSSAPEDHGTTEAGPENAQAPGEDHGLGSLFDTAASIVQGTYVPEPALSELPAGLSPDGLPISTGHFNGGPASHVPFEISHLALDLPSADIGTPDHVGQGQTDLHPFGSHEGDQIPSGHEVSWHHHAAIT